MRILTVLWYLKDLPRVNEFRISNLVDIDDCLDCSSETPGDGPDAIAGLDGISATGGSA